MEGDSELWPIFSANLDGDEAGMPHCVQAVAAAEKGVMASRDIVAFSDPT